MKRYKMGFQILEGKTPYILYPSHDAVEDPNGEWVKWSDIEKLRSKIIEEFSVNVANGKKAWIKKLFSSFENIK